MLQETQSTNIQKNKFYSTKTKIQEDFDIGVGKIQEHFVFLCLLSARIKRGRTFMKSINKLLQSYKRVYRLILLMSIAFDILNQLYFFKLKYFYERQTRFKYK